jgi:hypothetical protein
MDNAAEYLLDTELTDVLLILSNKVSPEKSIKAVFIRMGSETQPNP